MLRKTSRNWVKLGFLMGLILGAMVITSAQDGTPRPLFALPDARTSVFTSSSMALTRGGRILVMTNMLNNTVSIVDPFQSALLAEIPVGADPRTTAITPDDVRAVVVNRGDGTISIVDIINRIETATFPVGILPYGVVTNSDDRAYISLQATHEVVEINLRNGRILNRIPTPALPTGLALWGDFLYVTHLWSGQLSLIYMPEARLVQTISTGAQSGFTQSIEIDPSTGTAFLPQTRANVNNPAMTFDNTILPVVNRVDLHSMRLLRSQIIGLNVVDRNINLPFAARFDAVRKWLYVVNAGSNDLSVIDLNTGLARAHLSVGANPRGVLLNRDNSFLFVHNAIDGTLTSIETRNFTVSDVLPISDVTIPVDVLIGAELFNTASDDRLSANNTISCASCHFDGLSDGRIWKGVNTPLLFGLIDTSPYTWTSQWDEIPDLETHIRSLQRGSGLIEDTLNISANDTLAGQSLDLDALTAYLVTIPSPPVPSEIATTDLPSHGEDLFNELECNTCHTGDIGTDNQTHDVGTGGDIDTPSLRFLSLSAPYFHDGSAQTLMDVFHMQGAHQLVAEYSNGDLDALIAYLLAR